MAITTKRGDKGRTCLLRGGMVSKDDARIEACGTLDELCSALGLAKSMVGEKNIKNIIESIQTDLFTLGAEVTSKVQFIDRLSKQIGSIEVKRLERLIDKFETQSSSKKCGFCLPGENASSGSLDLARTVARRAERRIVTLKRKRMLKNDNCLIYLNRVSDLLYLLARSYDKKPRKPSH